jgi:predicted permease
VIFALTDTAHGGAVPVSAIARLDSIFGDIVYSFRLLRREPLISIVAVLMLAIGLGATCALFSILQAALVHPVPHEFPDRLVNVVWRNSAGALADGDGVGGGVAGSLVMTARDATAWQRESRVFETIALEGAPGLFLTVVDDPPERLRPPQYRGVTPSFFSIHRTVPVLGRAFLEEDMSPVLPQAVLISDAYWQRRYARSPLAVGAPIHFATVVGAPIHFATGTATIVGVMRPEFFPETSLWVPLSEPPRAVGSVLALLRPQVTPSDVANELLELEGKITRGLTSGRVLAVENASVNARRSVSTSGLSALSITAVIMVTLIAVNIAALQAIRSMRRRNEFAIRAACGASVSRLRRQLLIEGLVLASLGATVGMFVAPLMLRLLISTMPRLVPLHSEPTIGMAIGIATISVAMAMGATIGLLPAFRISRLVSMGPTQVLSGQTVSLLPRGTSGPLTAVQIALSVVLIGLSGLFIRDLVQAVHRDPGVDLANLVRLDTEPVEWSSASWNRYYPTVVEAIRQMPEVAAAGAIESSPGIRVNRVELTTGETFGIPTTTVLPGYLEALGPTVLWGRLPTATDRGAVVLNEAAARLLRGPASSLPDTVGIGIQRVRHPVLAVVENTRIDAPLGDFEPHLYQIPGDAIDWPMSVLVRLRGPAPGFLTRVRDAAAPAGLPAIVGDATLGPNLVWSQPKVQSQLRYVRLLSVWAAIGLVLAASSIAGLTAHSVVARTRELGIRLALGATPQSLVRRVVRDSTVPAIVGLIVGLGAAALASKLIGTQLMFVSRRDPTVYIWPAIAMAAAHLAAAWWPARRAASVDPAICLRGDS